MEPRCARTRRLPAKELVTLPLLLRALLPILLLLFLPHSAEALIRAKRLPPRLRACYQHANNLTFQKVVAGQYSWYCEASLKAHLKNQMAHLKDDQAHYIQSLYEKIESSAHQPKRGKRQIRLGMSRCLRKECRRLSNSERQRLWGAFNALKNDTSVAPNLFDALAAFHTGATTFIAHNGPGFLGWHRIYLLILEQALRQKDPGVCLCYWDSSLDGEMRNPTQCSVWSSDLFGNGNGPVTSGPFANWITRTGTPLTRALGVDGQPMSRRNILSILSRRTYEEVLWIENGIDFNLEFYHGAPHIFVGGDMEQLETAANEPVFYLHHCFIDYLFEVYRTRMVTNRLDPQAYPWVAGMSRLHSPAQRIGFSNLTHADGFLSVWTQLFSYEATPSCSANTCTGPYLTCQQGVCSCADLRNLPSPRTKREAKMRPSLPEFPLPTSSPSTAASMTPQKEGDPRQGRDEDAVCPETRPQAVQNSFCVDGHCDVNQWVWLPVKIVTQRPPEFTDYDSHPVQNGQISHEMDIYEPSAYSETIKYIKPNKPSPKAYDHCSVKDGVGKIFVSSQGINYDGYYKESSIVDQRLATSVSVAYIAVKDPGKGKTEVLLRARDQCGRVCQVGCKVAGSKRSKYRKCSGVIEVTDKAPKMYGQTYAAATLMTYDYKGRNFCPNVKFTAVYVAFFCDYDDVLPWLEIPGESKPASDNGSPVSYK